MCYKDEVPHNGTPATPDPVPASARGRETRERILDAARRLGREKGYAGTTMAAISRESGVHPGSVYWFFKDKDATFAAVIRETYAADIERSPDSGDAYARTLGLLAAPAGDPDRLGQWRFNALLMLDPALRDSASRRAFDEVRRQQRERLARIWVERLPPDAEAALAEQLASTALAFVDGALLAAAAGEPIDVADLARRLVSALDAAVDAAWAASAHDRPAG